VSDQLFVVMRVFFEKPRTTIGWKGLINDPHLDNSFSIEEGLRISRRILLEITGLGLPVATEILEPVTPLYISDLITVATIGARTTESPTHRQMASGLSMPVGHKNGTDGSLNVALDAMKSARHPHSFVGINDDGVTCIIHTRGNQHVFPILRGGHSGPNYSAEHIAEAVRKLNEAQLPPRLMVDCSHANSRKDYRNQGLVWNDVLAQRLAGNRAIVGMMLESHLHAGRQDLGADPRQLRYGVSITDGCIGWEETESLVLAAHERLRTT
jgi:3-deoxy-7-phosphoheptulonate synthase